MSGSHWSGPKIGIPPGLRGPAFRAPAVRGEQGEYPGNGFYGDAPPSPGITPYSARGLDLPSTSAPPDVPTVFTFSRDSFLSRLPPRGLQYFHRQFSFDGTVVMAAVADNRQLLFTLAPGQALIITRLVQNWLDAGTDPLDPDAMTSFPEHWDANGKVGFTIYREGSAIYDAQEFLFDPNGGAPVTRTVTGFTDLGRNLLEIGQHPSCTYIIEGRIEGGWSVAAIPAHVPTAVAVEIEGYIAPTKTVYETMIGNRRHSLSPG